MRFSTAPLVPSCLALLGVLLQEAPAPEAGEGWGLELQRPNPAIDGPGRPARLADLDRLDCAECHVAIAEEWSQTLHALAWVDERYQREVADKRRPKSCHGCHIPTPLHANPESFGRKPKPRSEQDEPLLHGISCASCHQGPDGVILGPFGSEVQAHPSQMSEHFQGTGSNALCLSCHQTTIGPVIGIGKDFLSGRLEERGMSCVGCHMAPVERPLARGSQDADGAELPARRGRSHLLQTPRDPHFLAQAFHVTAEVVGGVTSVRLANRAGHRVPGVLDRRLAFEAVALDALGEELDAVEATIDSTAYLPLAGTLEIRLEGAAHVVRLRGLHEAPGAEAPVPFLELELELEP